MPVNETFESLTGLPIWFAYLFTVLFGSLVGSFLNVVIHRVPRELSVVFPNSACPKCGAEIRPYDNIPVLSWLFLGGKCRNCKAPISFRYPAVEAANAALYALSLSVVGFNAFLPIAFIFVSAMLALILIDAEHMILPNAINFPLLAIFILVRAVYPYFFGTAFFGDFDYFPGTAMHGLPLPAVSLINAALGAVAGGGFLWLIGFIWEKLRGVEAMGLGDVKMMLAVGALLGWRLTFVSIFLGAMAGAVIGMVVVSRQKKKDMQTQIPFGIFLGVGSVVALLFGDRFVEWYLGTFVP